MRLAKRRTTRQAARTVPTVPDLLERVLASLEDAVVVTDENDRITVFNQAAEHLTGWPEAQVVQRPCAEVFGGTPALAAMVERTRTLGQSQSCGEELLSVAHREIPVRLSCSPIWGPTGEVQGAALVIQDLSYQKKLEQEARRNETLARLGSVVAGLAHEIKNPLSGIKGAAQLLAKRFAGEPDVGTYTGTMIREIDRLARLVEELLTLGAPPTPDFLSLNVHRLLGQVLALLASDLEAKNVTVRLEIDPSLPDVRGDEAQLTQVFLNLIKNALEAVPHGGAMTITTRMETDFHIVRRGVSAGGAHGGDANARAPDPAAAGATVSPGKFLRVEIADDGPGFSAAAAARVFEPFFTTKARGTGLGLSICERIVAVHGGDIRAENRREGGAAVTVTLPLAGP